MMQTTPQVSTARNQASLVVSGQDALALRLALIREARYSIMAQYYSWAEDVSGKLLLGALIAAARRGVKVRILVDDLYSGSNRYLESLAAEPNIQVRVFNPFWLRWGRPWGWALEILLSFRRLNHRMHNKLLVVDGDWAMVGGGAILAMAISAYRQIISLLIWICCCVADCVVSWRGLFCAIGAVSGVIRGSDLVGSVCPPKSLGNIMSFCLPSPNRTLPCISVWRRRSFLPACENEPGMPSRLR